MDWRKKTIYGLGILLFGTMPFATLAKKDFSYVMECNELEKRETLLPIVKEIYPSATIENLIIEEELNSGCPILNYEENDLVYQQEAVKISIGREVIGKYCINGRTNLSALNVGRLFYEDFSILLLKYTASILEKGNLNHKPYYELGGLEDHT